MQSYRKERIDNAILYFAKEHYKKTEKYLSQTALYKYLAFFEFRMLERYGEMPLELKYKAMEHGPVPMDVYTNRDNPNIFKLVKFESKEVKGHTYYYIKPAGKFDADYFSEDELSEMHSLIEIFAQCWIDASVMSDASHREIRAWQQAHSLGVNTDIDPIMNFSRNITSIPLSELQAAEERYILNRRMMEYANCLT
jgi:uncharacterized phage-associated protein